jgi:DNA-binding IclR family transcriptional regulator
VADPSAPPPPRSGVVDRAFALLDAFDDDRRAIRLSDLARRADLPLNTTLRLARNLVEIGALERDDQGRYVVGLRLFEIAALAPRGHGLRKTAMPYLGDLSAAVGQHVLLSVRDGDRAVLVERLSAHASPAVKYRIGGRLPLTCTGAGLVLLAHSPKDIQESQVSAHLPAGAGHPLFPPHELMRRLADIRNTNCIAVKARHPVTMSTAAAGIFVREEIVAAVSVVASPEDIDINAVLPAVVTVAHSIARALRSQPTPLPS